MTTVRHQGEVRPPVRMLAAMLAAIVCLHAPLGHAAAEPALPIISAEEPPDITPDQRAAELDAKLQAFLPKLRAAARAAGVGAAIFDRALADLKPDPSILDLLQIQPEHNLAPWEYLARLVSEKRIADGRRVLDEHHQIFAEIEALIGVDRHIVAAIWGIETGYGASAGQRSVLRSLATLAIADRRRPEFWTRELVAALTILQRGDIAPELMTGSWAGAMGHTQFMPTSFLAHAIDHDRDGRRDIWASVPDALASTAAYLRNHGWRANETWGVEVTLPPRFDFAEAGPRTLRTAAEWLARGAEPVPGAVLPAGRSNLAVLVPTGRHGPAFLVGPNFEAILKYNNATLYALAVGHLADRLAGRPQLLALWPVHDPPLDRAGRTELQERLASAGFAVGPIDGLIGDGTRQAIRAFQRREGIDPDGWAGTELLALLRARTGAVQQ